MTVTADPTPEAIESVLAGGDFCHLAARTERGPHLTPSVFVASGGSIWVTTSRGSVKARAWRTDPRVGGLVRVRDRWVTFTGTARAYDLLDPSTWPDVIARSARVTAASLRFSMRTARFFAGYAVDARHVPLAWTPPGRVFVEIEIDGAALLRQRGVVERWGDVAAAAGVASRAGYRSVAAADAFTALPAHIRRALGDAGSGAVALDGVRGPIVLPMRWASDGGPILASVAIEALALAGPAPARAAAVGIDRASSWRARRMLGCMIQGAADVFAPSAVRSGRRALDAAIGRTNGDATRDGLVRLRPSRVVWWEGWTSGSTRVA